MWLSAAGTNESDFEMVALEENREFQRTGNREPFMSAGATASDSPFIQGRNARLYGKARDSCPYSDDSEDQIAWLQAWDEAGTDDEAEIEKTEEQPS